MQSGLAHFLTTMLVVVCGAATADTQKDAHDCTQPTDLDRRIPGRSRYIDSRGTSNAKRSAAYSHRGNVHFNKGNSDRVIADSSEAIKLHPVNADAYCGEGASSYDPGSRQNAIADFGNSLRVDYSHALKRKHHRQPTGSIQT